MREKIILGIDPGTTIMGYGLIKVLNNNMSFMLLNELNLKKLNNHYLKLNHIFNRTVEIIDNYNPDEIAIEAPFFGKNVQWVAMAAGLSRQIPITEYSPKKIKMSITGNGNASKEQVAKMLMNILSFKELPKNLDSTDGLAAAVCHHFNKNHVNKETKFSSWKSYVEQNPKKTKL